MWKFWQKASKRVDKVEAAPSRRHEYEICVEFERTCSHNCPVRLRAGDGCSVGPCWHYLKDGKTCPVHGVVK